MLKLIKKLLKLILVLFLIFILGVYFVYNWLYPMNYKEEILKYSSEYEMDPYLVYAIINVESNFKTEVISGAEARGLMQIRTITADWAREYIELQDLSEEDYFNPDINLKIGCWYVSKLSEMYQGDITKIAAAYNAGTGNVSEWIEEGIDFNSEIPFEETKKYVIKVKDNMEVYKVLYGDNYTKSDAFNAGVKIIDVIYEKTSRRLKEFTDDYKTSNVGDSNEIE